MTRLIAEVTVGFDSDNFKVVSFQPDYRIEVVTTIFGTLLTHYGGLLIDLASLDCFG